MISQWTNEGEGDGQDDFLTACLEAAQVTSIHIKQTKASYIAKPEVFGARMTYPLLEECSIR